MARATRAVVQVERLSDQVYQLLREDLKAGHFSPGQRLLEVELADQYKVSRTPVREALFQLSREGLLVGNDRGYVTPTYRHEDIVYRLEVKRLLEPKLAEYAARDCDPQQIKAMGKALERERAAHAAGKVRAFTAANQEIRRVYRSMCKNDFLVRCLTMVDDQFDTVRSRILDEAANREKTMEHDENLMAAVAAKDPVAAVRVMKAFLDYIETYYASQDMAKFG